MLTEIHFQQYSRPIDTLFPESALGRDLVLDASYQRESVWTLEQRQNLIKSILQGLPIGILFINHRDLYNAVVVDGKQRIETVQMFANNEFSIPADWIYDVETGTQAFWMDLNPQQKRQFAHGIIATYETHLPGELEEIDLYERINYGGTPHEERVPVEFCQRCEDNETRELYYSHLDGPS